MRRRFRSSQRSLEASKDAERLRIGHRAPAQPAPGFEFAPAPGRDLAAPSSPPWLQKKRKGVLAAHSCPMKISAA